MSNEDFDWNGQRKPRKARGGIQSRSGQGDFARNWWARQAYCDGTPARQPPPGADDHTPGQAALSLEEFPGRLLLRCRAPALHPTV